MLYTRKKWLIKKCNKSVELTIGMDPPLVWVLLEKLSQYILICGYLGFIPEVSEVSEVYIVVFVSQTRSAITTVPYSPEASQCHPPNSSTLYTHPILADRRIVR